MTDNKIALLVKKEIILDVIELMRTGMDQKDALAAKGIKDSRTFNAMVAKFPEIAESMAEYQRSRISGLAEKIIKDQTENIEALSDYAEVLRTRIKNGILVDGAVKSLISIDKHMQNTLRVIYPEKIKPTGTEPPPPPPDASALRANQILAQMTGARRVHVEMKVETYRTVLEGQHEENHDVVTVEPIDVERTEALPTGESPNQGPESRAEQSGDPNLQADHQPPGSPQEPRE